MSVYKYYSSQPYNFEALIEGYFYFCKVSKLNDPYDASFDLLQSPNFLKFIKPKLSLNAREIMSNYGTCSFCEEKDNKVLWALYAGNYSGFVVEYDENTFESLNLDLQARVSYQKVVYRKERPDLDDCNYSFIYRNYEGEVQTIVLSDCMHDSKEMDKLFTHLCSYKDVVWEKENEWRLIVGNDIIQRRIPQIKYESGGYKIPIPQNAIKSIIVGHNFPKDRLCCIREAMSKYGIIIQRTKVGLPFCIDIEDYTFI